MDSSPPCSHLCHPPGIFRCFCHSRAAPGRPYPPGCCCKQAPGSETPDSARGCFTRYTRLSKEPTAALLWETAVPLQGVRLLTLAICMACHVKCIDQPISMPCCGSGSGALVELRLCNGGG